MAEKSKAPGGTKDQDAVVLDPVEEGVAETPDPPQQEVELVEDVAAAGSASSPTQRKQRRWPVIHSWIQVAVSLISIAIAIIAVLYASQSVTLGADALRYASQSVTLAVDAGQRSELTQVFTPGGSTCENPQAADPNQSEKHSQYSVITNMGRLPITIVNILDTDDSTATTFAWTPLSTTGEVFWDEPLELGVGQAVMVAVYSDTPLDAQMQVVTSDGQAQELTKRGGFSEPAPASISAASDRLTANCE